MENKDAHIDQLLKDKLNDLQDVPYSDTEVHIFSYLEHTSHPIDFALDKTLSDWDTEPQDILVHEQLIEGIPEIDLILNQRLRDYESVPDREFTIEQKRKKRTVLWLWFSAMSVLMMAVLYALYPREDIQMAFDNTNKTDTNNPSKATRKEHTKDPLPEITNNKVRIAKTKNKGLSKMRNNSHYSTSSTVEPIQTKDIMPINSEDFRHMKLKSIIPGTWQFESDINSIDKKISHYRDPIYKRFPLSFHLQAAYVSETSVSNQAKSRNQHKDAADLFSRSTGSRRTGIMIGFSAEHNLGKKIKISTGINYSSCSVSTPIDYYYTEIPVYDTTGALMGYFLRPQSASNHTDKQVISNSSSISIPVNIQYRIIPYKKLSIWMGIGCQMALRRTNSSEYFNFKTEQLSTVRQTFSKGLLPQMQLGLRYPINMRWQLSSQIQVARQSLKYQVYDAEYRRVELIPSFNIGLLYTPFIRIK